MALGSEMDIVNGSRIFSGSRSTVARTLSFSASTSFSKTRLIVTSGGISLRAWKQKSSKATSSHQVAILIFAYAMIIKLSTEINRKHVRSMLPVLACPFEPLWQMFKPKRTGQASPLSSGEKVSQQLCLNGLYVQQFNANCQKSTADKN